MSEQEGRRGTPVFIPLSGLRGQENYHDILAKRVLFFEERIRLNEEVPGALMPITHGKDGVGVISHVVFDPIQAKFILNDLLPPKRGDKSDLSLFDAGRILVFGENSDSHFFLNGETTHLTHRLTQSTRNSINRAYSDNDSISEDEVHSALNSGATERNISYQDYLRLLCMRLIQAQIHKPDVPTKIYIDWKVRVIAPSPIPPNEGSAAAALYIGEDGKTYTTTVILDRVILAFLRAYERYGSVEKACQSDETLRRIITGARDRQRQIDESMKPRYEIEEVSVYDTQEPFIEQRHKGTEPRVYKKQTF